MTIRVRVAFSMVYFVLPLFPANLPIPRLMCSPLSVCFTSFTSKHSKYKSSNRNNATASWISNPKTNACIKSADFCNADSSSVWSVVFNSTFFSFKFMRMSIFICFVTGVYSAIQCSFNGESLCDGTFTFRYIAFSPFFSFCFPKGAKIGRNGSFGFTSENNDITAFLSSSFSPMIRIASSFDDTGFPVLFSTTTSSSSSFVFFSLFGIFFVLRRRRWGTFVYVILFALLLHSLSLSLSLSL
mmetsp:Transcript_7715/g.25505  ORF Transcript_7715/g.25505 Transcript_7715/m.25505 type:complete len:242 (+) Transcript_7715:146-871(+)